MRMNPDEVEYYKRLIDVATAPLKERIEKLEAGQVKQREDTPVARPDRETNNGK